MSSTVVLFGGTFNPPGLHHRAIAEALAARFERVIVYPCGPRPEKPSYDSVESIFRAAAIDIAFRDMERVDVDLSDLEQGVFTPSIDLDRRFAAPHREVWHAVHLDTLAGGGQGASKIHRTWVRGPELWERARFVVIARPQDILDPADLPPHATILRVPTEGSSATIRERLFHRLPIDHLVAPEVADYIYRYRLYRGQLPNRVTAIQLRDPRVHIFADERNPRARAWTEDFTPFRAQHDPNCMVVLGGDGTMLAAVQEHWRKRLPFFGVNAGHLGFLLNQATDVLGGRFPPERLILRQLPMLYIETQDRDGAWTQHLTFNDAWIERATGQSAWLEVRINDQIRMPRLICDGALVSTAAASTAYARSMGATPLLADTPAWLLVGSNVMHPVHWRSALLSFESTVEIRSLDIDKRPLRAFLHGVPLGEVVTLRARMSRIASAELAFVPEYDMAEKIAQVQFPQEPRR